MTTYWNYSTVDGPTFAAADYRVGGDVTLLPYPNPEPAPDPPDPAYQPILRDARTTVTDGGQDGLGLYPVTELEVPATRDAYYQPADPPQTLAFVGVEYQAGATVERTRQYISQDADTIRSRKNDEGEAYARRVAFSSAQTQSNPNVYVLTDQLNLFFYSIVAAFYGDRHKDRVLGRDSSQGYDSTPPQEDPLPTTYWARDIPIYLVNANNGNELEVDANETDWGQVLKEVGSHILDTRAALRAYREDVGAKYDAYVAEPNEANRTALVSLNAEDPSYGWPPFYDGPTSGNFRTVSGER